MGDEQVPQDSHLGEVWAGAIKKAVDEAVSDARVHDEENATRLASTARKLKAVVGVLVVVVICLAITTGIVVNRQITHPTTTAIQRNQIAACQQANVRLKQDTGIWQSYLALQAKQSKDTSVQLGELISTLAKQDPAEIAQIDSILKSSSKVNTADQAAFIAKVAMVNAPKDCVAAYNISDSTPGALGSLYASNTVELPVARG